MAVVLTWQNQRKDFFMSSNLVKWGTGAGNTNVQDVLLTGNKVLKVRFEILDVTVTEQVAAINDNHSTVVVFRSKDEIAWASMYSFGVGDQGNANLGIIIGGSRKVITLTGLANNTAIPAGTRVSICAAFITDAG